MTVCLCAWWTARGHQQRQHNPHCPTHNPQPATTRKELHRIMTRYQVIVNIPESTGFVYVEADSPEDALAQIDPEGGSVFITSVNGSIEPDFALEAE